MALLLVDLHRGGVTGATAPLNTLFRRDGDRIQAYLVDAETSEVHPDLSDGQRRFDLDILVENVALASRPRGLPGSPGRHRRCHRIRGVGADRYEAVWTELHDDPEMVPGDRRAIRRDCGG